MNRQYVSGCERYRWLWLMAGLGCWLVIVSVSAANTALSKVDVQAEIAAALYSASATQAAEKQVADRKIQAQRQEIEKLRTKIHVGQTRFIAELTQAQEQYVAALAARDRVYAHEIAVFRAAIEDIAATLEGANALARFNAGDEIGAIAVLDDLRAARDAAREKRMAIESAAEGRRIALLALEARNKGKMTTNQVIERFEEVTQLDPTLHWDWIELGRLYRDAGMLPDALQAAIAAENVAVDDRDRSVALDAKGDVQVRQGDLAAALASYLSSHTIFERLAQADARNMEWQRGLSVSHQKIGDVQVRQGDLAAALTSYRSSHAIFERLVQVDAENMEWQRDLSVSHNKIGDVQSEQGNLAAALTSYRSSLAIRERLAQADAGNMEWQHDLIVSYVKLNEVTGETSYLEKALHVALALQQQGKLAPHDAWMIQYLQQRVGL